MTFEEMVEAAFPHSRSAAYEAEIDRVARMQRSYVERVLFKDEELEMLRYQDDGGAHADIYPYNVKR